MNKKNIEMLKRALICSSMFALSLSAYADVSVNASTEEQNWQNTNTWQGEKLPTQDDYVSFLGSETNLLLDGQGDTKGFTLNANYTVNLKLGSNFLYIYATDKGFAGKSKTTSIFDITANGGGIFNSLGKFDNVTINLRGSDNLNSFGNSSLEITNTIINVYGAYQGIRVNNFMNSSFILHENAYYKVLEGHFNAWANGSSVTIGKGATFEMEHEFCNISSRATGMLISTYKDTLPHQDKTMP